MTARPTSDHLLTNFAVGELGDFFRLVLSLAPSRMLGMLKIPHGAKPDLIKTFQSSCIPGGTVLDDMVTMVT